MSWPSISMIQTSYDPVTQTAACSFKHTYAVNHASGIKTVHSSQQHKPHWNGAFPETVHCHIPYLLTEDSLTSFGSLTYMQSVSKFTSTESSNIVSLECSTLTSTATNFRFRNAEGGTSSVTAPTTMLIRKQMQTNNNKITCDLLAWWRVTWMITWKWHQSHRV